MCKQNQILPENSKYFPVFNYYYQYATETDMVDEGDKRLKGIISRCLLVEKKTGNPVAVGYALCAPNENFDRKKGQTKAIAYAYLAAKKRKNTKEMTVDSFLNLLHWDCNTDISDKYLRTAIRNGSVQGMQSFFEIFPLVPSNRGTLRKLAVIYGAQDWHYFSALYLKKDMTLAKEFAKEAKRVWKARQKGMKRSGTAKAKTA
jgi:hypothetical protein